VCSKAEDKLKGEKRREEMQNGVRASFKSWMNPSSKTKQQIVPGWKHAWSWTWMDLCDTVRCQRKTKLTTTSLYKPTNKLKAVKRQGGGRRSKQT
jgi:hypothetical protein